MTGHASTPGAFMDVFEFFGFLGAMILALLTIAAASRTTLALVTKKPPFPVTTTTWFVVGTFALLATVLIGAGITGSLISEA